MKLKMVYGCPETGEEITKEVFTSAEFPDSNDSNDDVELDWNNSVHIHIVYDETNFKPYMCDMHSHGLDKIIGSELQYVLDVGCWEYFLERSNMFRNIAKKILKKEIELKNGVEFYYEEFGCPLRLFHTTDCYGEPIYRVIEPTLDGEWPEETDREGFKSQYDNPYLPKACAGCFDD